MIDNKKFSRAKKAPVVTNNTKYRPGDVVSLKVVRMNENAAFLDAGTGNTSDDIMLHKLQQTSEVNIGDEVKVYLYLDPSKRLTASMKLPKMREGQLGYVRVLSVTRDGGFVDIGAERGVFLPYSQMRGHVNPGQLVWVRLYRDKSGRQAVTMRVEEDMVKASKPAEGLKIGDKVTGTIYNILPEGFFLFTNQRFIAFLHRSEVPGGRLDFGQEVTCRVTYLREDGRINVSMRLQKENALLRFYAAGDYQAEVWYQQGCLQACSGPSDERGQGASGERLDLSDGRTARKVILIFEAQKNLLAEFFS